MLFARSLCHRMLDVTVVNADTEWDLIHFLVLQELQGVHPANGGAAVPGESLQPSSNDLLCRSACVLQDADYWVGEFLITPYACAGSATVAPAKYSKNPLTQSDGCHLSASSSSPSSPTSSSSHDLRWPFQNTQPGTRHQMAMSTRCSMRIYVLA